jgi:hypothetical protein
LKVGGTPITIDNPKIVNMNDRTKALEIRLDPALITNSGEVTIQFSTKTGTETDL